MRMFLTLWTSETTCSLIFRDGRYKRCVKESYEVKAADELEDDDPSNALQEDKDEEEEEGNTQTDNKNGPNPLLNGVGGNQQQLPPAKPAAPEEEKDEKKKKKGKKGVPGKKINNENGIPIKAPTPKQKADQGKTQ